MSSRFASVTVTLSGAAEVHNTFFMNTVRLLREHFAHAALKKKKEFDMPSYYDVTMAQSFETKRARRNNVCVPQKV